MNWIAQHQWLSLSFFATLLFAGLIAKIGQIWESKRNGCHFDAGFYSAACLCSLIGLVASGVVFLWEMIKP
jgi:hypothetical protein